MEGVYVVSWDIETGDGWNSETHFAWAAYPDWAEAVSAAAQRQPARTDFVPFGEEVRQYVRRQ